MVAHSKCHMVFINLHKSHAQSKIDVKLNRVLSTFCTCLAFKLCDLLFDVTSRSHFASLFLFVGFDDFIPISATNHMDMWILRIEPKKKNNVVILLLKETINAWLRHWTDANFFRNHNENYRQFRDTWNGIAETKCSGQSKQTECWPAGSFIYAINCQKPNRNRNDNVIPF